MPATVLITGVQIGGTVPGTPQALSASPVSPGPSSLIRATVSVKNVGLVRAQCAVQGHLVKPGDNIVQGHFFADQAQTNETAQAALAPGESRQLIFYKQGIAYRDQFSGNPSALDVLWSLAFGREGEAMNQSLLYRTAGVIQLPIRPQAPATPGAPWLVGTGLQSAPYAYLDIAWSPVAGATSYKVIHSDVVVATVSGTSVRIGGLSPNAPFTVAIQACNSVGCSAVGPSQTFYTASWPVPATPGAPWKVSDSVWCCGAGCASITFAWSPVAWATYYEVWHGSEFLGTVSGTQFTKSGLYGGYGGATYSVSIKAANPQYKSGMGPSASLLIRPC